MNLFLEIEDYLLPCLTKKFLGFDCLGCGLQRSFVFLIKGEFTEAFVMYPAIYTLLLLIAIVILNLFLKKKLFKKVIPKLAIINIALILGSYVFKMSQLL